MLTSLPYDLQSEILKFQEPEEIIASYKSCETIFEQTIKHTSFIVDCKVILSDEEIEWFKSKNIKVKLIEEHKIDEYGDQRWYKNGELHRDNDLPAVILSNGTQFWYQNGKLHRDNDLPAIIYPSGHQIWYKNGKRYHKKMPAKTYTSESERYYENGMIYISS